MKIHFSKIVCKLAILVICLSCSDDDIIENNTINSVKVSTGELYPDFNPEITEYYISSLNTLKTIEVTLEDYNTPKRFFINMLKNMT